jgi:transketolase
MNMDLDNKIATRESFGKALVELGKGNENVVVLTADLAGATKTSLFEKEFPDRFINVGIAEQNMIGISAGLATTGKIPFASTFAMFAAGRAYDQIRNSVAYPKLNVKICGTHAGVTVGEDGATHQMLEDLSLMRSIPNMTVLCTSDDVQTRWAVKEMAKIDGPVYIRLARVATPVIYDENQKFEIGKMVQIGDGTDATVFATGVEVAEALKAKEELEKENINIRVVDVHTIKPIDREMIIKCAKETKKLITIEDHNVIGGLGTAVCEVLSEECPTKVVRMGMQDRFGKSGKAEQLLKYFKLDSQAIIEEIKG